MKRFGLLSGTTLVLLLASGAAAWACNPPGIGVTAPDPAYPGDPIYYTITDMTSGATYSVKVNDTVVISKRPTSTDAPVSGEFPLPDMGPGATSVSVEVIVEHGDIENADQTWDRTSPQNIQYGGESRPVAEPQQASGSSGTSGEATQTPQQSESGSSPAATAPPASGPATSAPRPPGGGPTRVSQPRRQPSRISDRAPAVRERTPGRHEAGAIAPPAAEPALGAPVPVKGTVPRSKAGAAVKHLAAAVPITVAAPEVAAMAPERAAPGPSLRASQRTDATRDLLVLALASAFALAVVVMRRRGFGRPQLEPDPDPAPPGGDAIEAELQEIIAEERARAERLSTRDA